LGFILLSSTVTASVPFSFATSHQDWDVKTVGEFTVDLSSASGTNKIFLSYSGNTSFDIVSGNLLDGSGRDSVTMKMIMTSDGSDCSGTGSSSISYNIRGNYEPSSNIANVIIYDYSSPSGNIEMTCKMTISGETMTFTNTVPMQDVSSFLNQASNEPIQLELQKGKVKRTNFQFNELSGYIEMTILEGLSLQPYEKFQFDVDTQTFATVQQGTSIDIPFTVKKIRGSENPSVFLSATDWRIADISVSLNPSSITPTGSGTLKITTTCNTEPDNYQFTIRGETNVDFATSTDQVSVQVTSNPACQPTTPPDTEPGVGSDVKIISPPFTPTTPMKNTDVVGEIKVKKGDVVITTDNGETVNSDKLEKGQTIQTGSNPDTNVQIALENNAGVIVLQENTKLSIFEINDEDIRTEAPLPPIFEQQGFTDQEIFAIGHAFNTGMLLGVIPFAPVGGTLVVVGYVLVAGSMYFGLFDETGTYNEDFVKEGLGLQKKQEVIFTPNALLIPQGTKFTVILDEGVTKLDVLEGEVLVIPYDTNQATSIISGESSIISENEVEITKFDTTSTDKWWEVSDDQETKPITPPENGKVNGENGGCLIATATFGSELAPQVQQLRELRDNSLLQTESGTSFMGTFNDFYYLFSPTIADYERENPVFKEMVKIAITPMISSLSILNYVDMDSESSVLGYGISLILLNAGMYFGLPVIVIVGFRRKCFS